MKFKDVLTEQMKPEDVQAMIKTIYSQMDQLSRHVQDTDKENLALKADAEKQKKLQAMAEKKKMQQESKPQKPKSGIGSEKNLGGAAAPPPQMNQSY